MRIFKIIILIASIGWLGNIEATVSGSYSFSTSDLSFSEISGYDLVSLPQCSYMDSIGAPRLPVFPLKFAIPRAQKVVDIEITYLDSAEVEGTYLIYPAQPQFPLDGSSPPDFVDPDPTIYESSEPFPAIILENGRAGYAGGWKLADVALHPLKYIPAARKLWLYTEIDFDLILSPGEDWGLTIQKRTEGAQDNWITLIKSMVENPDQVESFGPQPQIVPASETWECIIITDEALCQSFELLRDWNTRRGLRTKVVTMDTVMANYPPCPDTQTSIREFIKSHHDQGTQYVLLGSGDITVIPPTTWWGYGAVPTDLYYSALEGSWDLNGNGLYGDTELVEDPNNPGQYIPEWEAIDYEPDVWVGRALIDNLQQADEFVERVLNYQKSPSPGYDAEEFLFLGAAYGGGSSGGEDKEDIVEFMPPWADYYRFYDVYFEGEVPYEGICWDLVKRELDLGHYLINHAGHGSGNYISIAAENPQGGDVWTNADMDGLHNHDATAIFYSTGCFTGAFHGDCIAEHWLHAPDGGGVSYLGHTQTSWTDAAALFDRYFARLAGQRDLCSWRGFWASQGRLPISWPT